MGQFITTDSLSRIVKFFLSFESLIKSVALRDEKLALTALNLNYKLRMVHNGNGEVDFTVKWANCKVHGNIFQPHPGFGKKKFRNANFFE